MPYHDPRSLHKLDPSRTVSVALVHLNEKWHMLLGSWLWLDL